MSALQALFAADLTGDLSSAGLLAARERNESALPRADEDSSFTEGLLRGIAGKRTEIDAVIEKAAPQWPLAKIAAVDRNILRVGLYELLFGASVAVPPKVALNEAIELAKIFGGESSGRFVNGVLGSVYREIGSPRKEESPKSKDKEYFAGAVVCATKNGTPSVALVKDPFGKWTLPKARYEKGELSDSAALRAIHEDLGLPKARLLAPLMEHEYEAHAPGQGVLRRRVAYFVACTPKEPLVSSHEGKAEGERTGWFSESELSELDLYDDLRGIIESGIVAARSSCI